MKKIIIKITIMVICFFISSLFFINSEIIDEESGEINVQKGIDVLKELDKMPFINIDIEEIQEEIDIESKVNQG